MKEGRKKARLEGTVIMISAIAIVAILVAGAYGVSNIIGTIVADKVVTQLEKRLDPHCFNKPADELPHPTFWERSPPSR